jgi:hypothetical protein
MKKPMVVTAALDGIKLMMLVIGFAVSIYRNKKAKR